MKVIFIGQNGWIEKSIIKEMKRKDMQVFHVNYLGFNIKEIPVLYQIKTNQMNQMIFKLAKKINPDVLFVLKGEKIYPKIVKKIKKISGCKTILWFSDDPQLFERSSQYLAPAYDKVFTSSFLTVSKYRKIGVNAEYIPFFCDPDLHKKLKLSEKDKRKYECDISFVGTFYPVREKILKLLDNFDVKIYGNNWKYSCPSVRNMYAGRGIYGKELVKLFNASKIVLNIHSYQMKYGGMKSNIRNFEATGCKSFVLSDNTIGLEDLFDLGKEIEVYQNKNELIEKIKFYLNNPKERKKIAKAGQKRTYKDHTIKKRIERILG